MDVVKQKTPECNHTYQVEELGSEYRFTCHKCGSSRNTYQDSCQDLFDIMNYTWVGIFVRNLYAKIILKEKKTQ